MSKDQPNLNQEELRDLIHRVLAGNGTSEEDEFIFDLVQRDQKVAETFRASALQADEFERAIAISKKRMQRRPKTFSDDRSNRDIVRAARTRQEFSRRLRSKIQDLLSDTTESSSVYDPSRKRKEKNQESEFPSGSKISKVLSIVTEEVEASEAEVKIPVFTPEEVSKILNEVLEELGTPPSVYRGVDIPYRKLRGKTQEGT